MPDQPRFQRALDAYIDYFEKLNARSVRLIEKLAVPGMQFRDPFNDVAGIEQVEAILQKMFVDVQSPKFRVHDYAWGRDQRTAYIKWRFTATMAKGRQLDITGMSELYFNDNALVMTHIDYWDPAASIYEDLPLLGRAIRWVRGKISA
jgi:steroid delta-isomerase